MFVCICEAVTDTEIGAAMDAGAETVSAVAGATRAGKTCGTCHDHIETMLETRIRPCVAARLQPA
jgi:bacterioferritin-associated ferredoxin